MKELFSKSFNIIILFLILACAVVLRGFYLESSNGLTLSEIEFFKGFSLYNFDEILGNLFRGEVLISLPSLFTSWWCNLLGDDIYLLRFFFLIFGSLTCLLAYFTCEKPQNYICVLLFAINSFLIFYSQEVGIYAFLGFIGVLNIYSFIKITKDDKGYVLWGISNICLILTSLFSILFSLLEILVLFLFKKEDRKFFITSIISFICIIPYFVYILYAHNFYINNFIDIDNGYQSIFTIIQNLFSPMLINVASANVLSHFQTLFREINFYSLGFVIVPVIIGLYFIYGSFTKDRFNIILFVMGIAYLFVRGLLQFLFGIPFDSGEYIIVVTLMLILMAKGFDKDILSVILLILFVALNVSYLIIDENSAFKNQRNGILTTTDFINTNLSTGDVVITWTKIVDFEHYLGKKVDLLNFKDDFIDKTETELLDSHILSNNMLAKNKRNSLRQYFVSRAYPKNTIFIVRVIYGKLQNNNRLFIIYPKNYSDDYNKFLNEVAEDDEFFNMPYDELMEKLTLVQLNKILSEILKLEKKEVQDNFIINVYKK